MPIPIGVLANLGSAGGGNIYFAKALFQTSSSLEGGAFALGADDNLYFLNRSNSTNQFLILNKITPGGVLAWQTRLTTLTNQGNENQKFSVNADNNPVPRFRTTSSNDGLQLVASSGASSTWATSAVGSSLATNIRHTSNASTGYGAYGSLTSAGADCLIGYYDSSGVIQWFRRVAYVGSTNDQMNTGFFNTASSIIEAYGGVQDGGFVPRPFLMRVNTSNTVQDFWRYTNTNEGDNFTFDDAVRDGTTVYTNISGSGTGQVLMKLVNSRAVDWAYRETSIGGNYQNGNVVPTPDGGVIHVVRRASNQAFILQYTKLTSTGVISWSRRITSSLNISFYGGNAYLDSTGALIMTATVINSSTTRTETVIFRVPSDGTITQSSFVLNGFTYNWATHSATYADRTSVWSREVPTLAANTSTGATSGTLSTTLNSTTLTQEATTTL